MLSQLSMQTTLTCSIFFGGSKKWVRSGRHAGQGLQPSSLLRAVLQWSASCWASSAVSTFQHVHSERLAFNSCANLAKTWAANTLWILLLSLDSMHRRPMAAISPTIFEPTPGAAFRRTIGALHIICKIFQNHVFTVATAAACNNPAVGLRCQIRLMHPVYL